MAGPDLSELLGGVLPDSVAALPPEVLERLAEQVQAARRRQAQQIADAIQVAVKGVPLPVRGIVRKALLG